MKKLVWITMILSVTIVLTGCKKKGCTDSNATNYSEKAKKDDGSCIYPPAKNPPTITITGEDSVSVLLGTTYTDQGATAVDHDGNPVTVTNVSDVNTNQIGNYTVVYTATDANGTTNKTRYVSVYVSQSSYLGDYAVVSDCPTSLPLAATSNIVAGASAGEVIIENFLNLLGEQCLLQINGTTITVPNQTINIIIGDLVISGSGSMNNTGTVLTITFDYDNNAPFVGGVGTCTATYTKQ